MRGRRGRVVRPVALLLGLCLAAGMIVAGMAFPAESVIVEVCGNWPVARSVDTLFTLSPASLDTIPTANAPGNAIPATNTPASTHSASNKPTGRSR